MVRAVIPDDAWPAGDRLAWDDDDARVHWDFTTEPWTQTPYTDEENAEADERAAAIEQAQRPVTLRQQIADLLDEEPGATRDAALIEALARLALEGS